MWFLFSFYADSIHEGMFYTVERLASFYGLHHSWPGRAEEPEGWGSG